jgi:hypothetical protein
MAKNQNLALIPTKLNGVCGQIKCCIKYEDDVYTDKRRNLPREGALIATRNGDCGKVLKLHILVEQFEMLTDTGIKRTYSVNQYHSKDSELGADYRFPETFEHITNETSTVIGLTVEEKVKADLFMEQNIYKTVDKNIEGEELSLAANNSNIDEFVDEEDNLVAPQSENVRKAHTPGTPGEPRPPGQGKNRNRNRNRNRNKNRDLQGSGPENKPKPPMN